MKPEEKAYLDRIAAEVVADWRTLSTGDNYGVLRSLIWGAVRLAVYKEREACAKIVEKFKTGGPPDADGQPTHVSFWGEALASAIRARIAS